MRGLALDGLTVTGPDDKVLITPHYRDQMDDINKTKSSPCEGRASARAKVPATFAWA